jgi:hypothetical protein
MVEPEANVWRRLSDGQKAQVLAIVGGRMAQNTRDLIPQLDAVVLIGKRGGEAEGALRIDDARLPYE